MERKYLISKVNVSNAEHSELHDSLDKFYNTPENYFNEDYLSYVSDSPKFAFNLFQSSASSSAASSTRCPHKDLITYTSPNRNHHPSQSKQRKTIMYNSFKDDNTTSNQILTESEVHQMFNKINKRQSNNTDSNGKDNNSNGLNGQYPLNANLRYQSNALKLRRHHSKRNQRVLNELALKNKRTKEELLMNTTNDHRVKQEAKLYLNKYTSKKNYWIDLLRQPNIAPYQKVDAKRFLINKGTYMHPKWDITSLDAVIENVVDPTVKDETVNESTLGFNFLSQNSMEHTELSKVIDKSERLKGINVEGKSCFKVEYDNFKSMRGNKFIKIHFPKEHWDDVTFCNSKSKRNVNNSLLMTGRMITSSKDV